MTRDELITAIRAQVDLDEEDLPLPTASLYLREAFERTAAQERRWPSYEADWQYLIPADEGSDVLDPTTAEIAEVFDAATGRHLLVGDHHAMRTNLFGQTGQAQFFSVWGGRIHFWPAPSSETTFVVSGYRKPSYTWLSDTAAQVDLDDRLHISLYHYGVALAYAQQEDELLENQYMRRWQENVSTIRSDIMKSGVYRPVVLNGGEDNGFGITRAGNYLTAPGMV